MAVVFDSLLSYLNTGNDDVIMMSQIEINSADVNTLWILLRKWTKLKNLLL